MKDFTDLETVCAGIFIALSVAIGPQRTRAAIETLEGLAADSRTSDYARQYFCDLIDCVEMIKPQPVEDFDFDQLATLH
jgi:hypothetical protein